MSFSLSLVQVIKNKYEELKHDVLASCIAGVCDFPREMNVQWDFTLLFLQFLSPTFLVLILSCTAVEKRSLLLNPQGKS